MAQIRFAYTLKRFYPDLKPAQIQASRVKEVLDQLELKHPGIRDYLVDEHGRLREHVNIFIGEEPIQDEEHLSDVVKDSDEIYIAQAVSGG